MTIASVSTPNALTQLYEGLSSDTKPTVGVQPFALFKETDTGNVYEYSGTSWQQTTSGGAVHVQSGTVDGSGNFTANPASPVFPASWYLSGTSTAADVNDNTDVYVSPDVSIYNHHSISIVTAPGAGAVEVHVSLDGTNWEATPVQVISDALVEGAAIQSVNEMTAIGNYHFTRKVKLWRLRNKGATTGAATSIRFSHGVV